MSIVRPVMFGGRVAALSILVLSMASPVAAEMCVDVHLRFADRAPSRELVESMQNETSSIWESYGLRIQWPTTEGLARCERAHGSFDVFIDHPRVWRRALIKATLGSTRVTFAAINHVPIYIDQDAIEQLLESLGAGDRVRLLGRPVVVHSDVGRALGRVLAHEIGHVILAARVHRPRGLMRPAFRASDLLERRSLSYTLSSEELTQLHDRELDLEAQLSAPDSGSSETPGEARTCQVQPGMDRTDGEKDADRRHLHTIASR